MSAKITFLGLVLGFSGCASLPGAISVSKSDYDGATEVYMKPGFVSGGLSTSVKVGALKTSKMEKNEVVLEIRNDLIKHFSVTHPNLFLMVDGKESKLSPTGKISKCEVSTKEDIAHCWQRYMTTMDLVKALANSKDAKVKLQLSDSYVDGVFSDSGYGMARPGLKKFLEAVEKNGL